MLTLPFDSRFSFTGSLRCQCDQISHNRVHYDDTAQDNMVLAQKAKVQ